MTDFLLRIDIDNPSGHPPKLVGLAIRGFGWILGGSDNGDLSIAVYDDGRWEPFDKKNTQQQVDRFRRKFNKFDYVKNGWRNWPVTDEIADRFF